LSKLIQRLFFGTPSRWYIGGGAITDDNRPAIIEWLEDRQRFHIWLTSIVSGASVFLATLGQPLESESAAGILKLIGLGVMMVSILANMVSIWSISNYKFNVKTGMVKEGSRLRFDIEIVTALAAGTFLIGFTLAVLPSVI
jgi:hypothetical protein